MEELDEWEQRRLQVRARLDEADPIWGEMAEVHEAMQGHWLVSSGRSGSYAAPPDLRGLVAHWPPAAKARLTTWIGDQNRSGERFPAVTREVLSDAFGRKPLRYSAKLDRLFAHLAHIGHRPGDLIVPRASSETIEVIEGRNVLMRVLEATGQAEYYGILAALIGDGMLDSTDGRLTLSAKGLSRLDDQDRTGAVSSQAFVAMWFSREMEAAFQFGFAPGLAEAGYRALKINDKEHANKIDDEIIAEIRRSRFIVADFTCGTVQSGTSNIGIPRGGVYYEAGFAQGLGIPVIWTVREDQVTLVHFDTRQFNHITWRDPDELRVKLARRVLAVIGAPLSRTAT